MLKLEKEEQEGVADETKTSQNMKILEPEGELEIALILQRRIRRAERFAHTHTASPAVGRRSQHLPVASLPSTP